MLQKITHSFLIQDAIQEYHWDNILSKHCLQKGQPDSYTRIFSNAVHAFLGKVLNLFKDSWSTLQNCIYFSDGASSQYNNYKNFANLCHHASEFQLAAKRDFFPLPHGKSLCNGIGGTVKHLVANAYLQSLK